MNSRKQSAIELYSSDNAGNGDGGGNKKSSRSGTLKKNYSLQENLKSNSLNDSSMNAGRKSLGVISEIELVNCNCSDGHLGRECLNQVYDMEIDYLYSCLFGYNEFHIAFSQLRKISDTHVGDWKVENGIRTRRLEYNVTLLGIIGAKSCKNVEHLRVQKFDQNEVYVVESETFSSGVPYADYFKVNTRFCLTKVGSHRVRLIVHSSLTFLHKTNFIIKNLIEKNCTSALNEYFSELDKHLTQESIRIRNNVVIHSSTSEDLLQYSSSTSSNNSSTSGIGSQNNSHDQSTTSFAGDSSGDDNDHGNHVDELDSSPQAATTEGDSNLIKRKSGLAVEAKIKQRNSVKKAMSHHSSSKEMLLTSSPINSHHATGKLDDITFSPSAQSIQQGGFLTRDLFLKLFFLLMIVLLVFNLVMYMKLREIEQVANILKDRHRSSSYNLASSANKFSTMSS